MNLFCIDLVNNWVRVDTAQAATGQSGQICFVVTGHSGQFYCVVTRHSFLFIFNFKGCNVKN